MTARRAVWVGLVGAAFAPAAAVAPQQVATTSPQHLDAASTDGDWPDTQRTHAEPPAAELVGTVHWLVPDAGVVFGEPFGVEVTVAWPAGAEVAPLDAAVFGPVAVEPVGVRAVAAGERRRYRAVAWAVGDVVLPPFGWRARRADGREVVARCAIPPLTVRSVLPAGADGGVEWPEPFVATPTGGAWWWPWAGLAAVLVAAGFARRRRPAPTAAAAPTPSARDLTLAGLAALPPPDADAGADAVAAWYTALAAIVRAFAGRGGAVPAATRTSEELLAAVGPADPDLRACLSSCDAVKFAAGRPGTAAHEAAHAAAVAFVRGERRP